MLYIVWFLWLLSRGLSILFTDQLDDCTDRYTDEDMANFKKAIVFCDKTSAVCLGVLLLTFVIR